MGPHTEKFDSHRLVTLVSYCATPFALLLGLMAVVLTDLPGWPKTISLGLLGFAAIFNLGFMRVFTSQGDDKKGWNVKFRLYMNLVINVVVLYLLGEAFPPLWMLLALTPFATAVYGGRQHTLINAFTSVVVLMGVRFLRNQTTPLEWGVVVAECVFIVLISLMINGVASLAPHPDKPSGND